MWSLGACRPGICCSTYGLAPSPTHLWTLFRCVNLKPAAIEGDWLRCLLQSSCAERVAGLQVLPVIMFWLSKASGASALQRR